MSNDDEQALAAGRRDIIASTLASVDQAPPGFPPGSAAHMFTGLDGHDARNLVTANHRLITTEIARTDVAQGLVSPTLEIAWYITPLTKLSRMGLLLSVGQTPSLPEIPRGFGARY